MPARDTALPTGRWVVDLTRTRLAFTARGAFGSVVNGTIPVLTGVVTSTDGGVRVTADLDLEALDTGNPRRDKDLRKPRLLDLDAHPRAHFSGRAPGLASGELDGVLRARGRDVPVRVQVELHDGIPAGSDLTVDVVARCTVDRRDLGISVPAFMIGRRIDVTVTASLVPQRPGGVRGPAVTLLPSPAPGMPP